MPKTKIICTLGPASSTAGVVRKMMAAGMDIARLNFSHGSHAHHLARIKLIRFLNKKYRRHIRILQDLEGYRIRIGHVGGSAGIPLKKRQKLILTQDAAQARCGCIPFDFQGSLSLIKPGMSVFIDDGNIELAVRKVTGRALETVVVIPGVLKARKGINIPQVRLPFKGLTVKDRRDLAFGIRHRVDFIAQSFVRDKDDIMQIRQILKGKMSTPCGIIAKIENGEGIKNIDRIIAAADGIMIARGDMGVSLPIYKIPIIQKEIIAKCLKAGKMVITATQMLESMTERRRPTRAEVTDVANAIIDGSGYLMLSAETAAGSYPAEAVSMMNEIIKFTEASLDSVTHRLRRD